ncbi:hypothetical protein FQA39_LY01840 [Lamprigera yunnana]|nr:hypothetical protein FQA39_LY01840 [Lamprigera yunnana]
MRLLLSVAALIGLVCCQSVDETNWSWNGDDPKPSEFLNQDELEQSETILFESTDNKTTVEEIVNSILASSRQGRNLNGYDELYNDPSVQEVLQKGDDVEAKNIIKDKLCSLGLMQCDGELIQGKRPYISPEDLVYAQPVDIKPIGRPIPSIPVNNPIRKPHHYGPPRPNPIPNKYVGYGGPNNPNSPPRRGFGPPQRPIYGPPHGKPFGNGPPVGSYFEESEGFLSKPPGPGPIYSQPIEPSQGYDFEHISTHHSSSHNEKKPVEVLIKTQNGVGATGVQQHVHHHFHHASQTGTAGNIRAPVSIPVPVSSVVAGNTLSSQNTLFRPASSSSQSTSSAYYNNYREDPSSSNLPLTIGGTGFSGSYGGQTIANYGGQASNFGGLSSFGTHKPVTEDYEHQTLDNNFGASVGLYGNSGLYKKELKINGGGLNSIQSNFVQSTYAGNYKGLESVRSENYDCICVPFNQCPSHDVIGRKDDLYLAIDPRNLKSNIDAISEERVITDGNGTMTVIRVPKEAKDEEVQNEDVDKKLVKREASSEKNATNIESRQNMFDNRRVKPTFGVSFGLPNQGGGGYPINPLGHYPVVNPYGGTIGGGGINLGLVSVNPLLSIQVTKDDYGEKVIKPFVNLHVTPNDFLVHKLDNLFALKKHTLFNKHQHFHQHDYPFHHRPHHTHDYPGHYEEGPYLHEPPHFNDYPEYNGPPVHNYFPPGNYAPAFGGDYEGGYDDDFYGRAYLNNSSRKGKQFYQNDDGQNYNTYTSDYLSNRQGKTITASDPIKFPNNRKRRDTDEIEHKISQNVKRQAHYLGGGNYGRPSACGPRHVCCKRPLRPQIPTPGFGNPQQCGIRHSQGINGRIKNPVYVDGDSEFGEYPWQVAILKKDPKESVYVCGGTLIDSLHIITAAHCVRSHSPHDLRVRLGEWDVNHDVEFYPYVERDISSLDVHPEFYAGTLYNDLALLRMEQPVDFSKYPHISSACLPRPQEDFSGHRCWTTGWGKDAFGEFGKYQNILKEVDVPIISFGSCQQRLQQTRLGYEFKLHPGFICAGGEEGKDACKGDGGGPMVCERGGTWKVVGVVSWGIGCGQPGIPGVYVNVAHYLDWIRQLTQRF